MNDDEFALNPADYGLPTRRQLQELRIWDDHYHGFYAATAEDVTGDHDKMQRFADRMGIERSISLDIGGKSQEAANMEVIPVRDDVERRLLVSQQDRLSGIIRIDPSEPVKSCEKMERWIRNGPCIGIKYIVSRDGLRCDHPNSDPIIRLAAELDAVIYIHTWLKVGPEPPYWGAGTLAGENTPMNVVALGRRFPDVRLICGHSGGDWEIALQVVKASKNVYFEFAGSDSHSGMVDLAARELGVERLTWGAHGPSRSYATELSKVLDATLTHEQRKMILGGNYRRLAEAIFRKKGYSMASRWGVA